MKRRSDLILMLSVLLAIVGSSRPVFGLFWLYKAVVGCMFVAIACAAVFSVSDYLSEKHSGSRMCWQFVLIFVLSGWGMSLLFPAVR